MLLLEVCQLYDCMEFLVPETKQNKTNKKQTHPGRRLSASDVSASADTESVMLKHLFR